MTGRRLYDLFCDGWASQSEWIREDSRNQLKLPANPPAWPFLSNAERRIFNRSAARLKGVKR